MMLPRPEAWFRPAAQKLRPVRWNRLAVAVSTLLALYLAMMWLAPAARGSAAACRAAAEAVLAAHAGQVLPEGWRPEGVARFRVLAPGDAATMDFDTARLTVHVDAARRLMTARCE